MRGTDPTKSKWVCLKCLHICKNYFTFCMLFFNKWFIYYLLFVILDRINSIFNPVYIRHKNILRFLVWFKYRKFLGKILVREKLAVDKKYY